MKASYKLRLEQEQRRLNLSHKELNKYDKKHNNSNLIKYLQSLEPVVPIGGGFWGSFELTNIKDIDSNPRYLNAYLAYNNVPLTSSQQINSNQSYTFNIAQANRLPSPNSILQLKITMQSATTNLDVDYYTGFQVAGITNNPLDQENTLSCLVDGNNNDNGLCLLSLLVYT